MGKIDEVLKTYSATWNDVVAWASTQPKWSKFVSNKRLVAYQYLLDVKKIKPQEAQDAIGMGLKALQEATAKLVDLEMGKWHTVRGVVVSQQRETSYKGCPTCFKKIAEGQECEKDGEEPVDLHWRTYIFADDTDDVILSVPPKLQSLLLLGKEIMVRGNLNDQLEFHAAQIQILDSTPEQQMPTNVTAVQQTSPPAQATSTPQVSTIVVPEELQQITDIVKLFKSMDMKTLEIWHSKNGIKTPLQLLIASAGFKITGDIVSVA